MSGAPAAFSGKPAGRWAFWFLGLLAAAILLKGWLAASEQTIRGFTPGCLFHRFTGLHCPGCGMTRSVFALANGDPVKAWTMNPLLILILGALTLHAVLSVADRFRQRPAWLAWARPTPALGWASLGLVAAFWVLRNIPHEPFTALAPH